MRIVFSFLGFCAAVSAATAASAAVSVFGGGAAQTCSEAAFDGKYDPVSENQCSIALETEGLATLDKAGTLINRGVMRLRRHAYDLAQADLDAGIALAPAVGEGWINRGALWVAEKRFRDGIADITKGLALGVKEPEKGYYNRALAYEGIDDEKAAYFDYQQALTIKPGWELPEKELLRFTLTRK